MATDARPLPRPMHPAGILVVTGASGAGKTAAVECLQARGRPEIRCHFFDRIGVPSAEVMTRDFGGPEGWQADATYRWIERLAAATGDRALVHVLDAQMRPSFVRAALARVDAPVTQIVLVACSPAVRRRRLSERGHPELATARMERWAAYLLGQADALELPVVDTSGLDVDAVADTLEAEIETLRGMAPTHVVDRTKDRARER